LLSNWVSAKRLRATNVLTDRGPASRTLCAATADAIVAVVACIRRRSRAPPHHLVLHLVPSCHDDTDADRIGGYRLGYSRVRRDFDGRRHYGANGDALRKSALRCHRHQHSRRNISNRFGPRLGQSVGVALTTHSPARAVSAMGVRRGKAALSSGCETHPATAPAGSNRSSHGGDEMAEAFG
jgi:hypothetical protein